MRTFVIETFRQGTGFRIALPIGKFGVQNARGAGAEKHTNALAAVTLSCSADCFNKIILFQTELRETIIAAIVSGEVGAHRHIFQTIDAPDIGVQIDIQKITMPQPGAARTQRVQRRSNARSQRRSQGVGT